MFVVKVCANRKQQDWPTRFTSFPESSYFAFQERQGVSNVDTPEVTECTCVFVCVCVSVFVHEYVSK